MRGGLVVEQLHAEKQWNRFLLQSRHLEAFELYIYLSNNLFINKYVLENWAHNSQLVNELRIAVNSGSE